MLTTQKLLFTIAPTDDAGVAGPVTNIQWSTNLGDLAVAADGLSAVFSSAAAGLATVSVSAVNAAGTVLAESLDVAVSEPAVVVTKLNLTAGEPT